MAAAASALPVHVLALGASTPVGRSAWASAAAVRAGISGFRQHPYMIDAAGEPMRVAAAPWLAIDLAGVERLEALLVAALDQVMEPLAALRDTAPRVALALGLPGKRPGLPADLSSQLGERLAKRYARAIGARAIFPCGHASALLGLDAALRKLQKDELDACIVAGVDSYLEPETLEWLEDCDQLHGGGALNNAWGFVPGEGAGAVLIGSERVASASASAAASGAAMPLVRVIGSGTAFEPKSIKSQRVCIGEGLTEVLRATLAALPPGARVSDIYCDMNGEPYRADEFGFAGLRVGESFTSLSDFVAPADCWGDVGAASGPLQLVLAVAANAKGYAHGSTALAWASSESGERAAVLLAAGG
jgi:3-oxoacyl-[acyl-carrier-protein] synthase-1